MSKVVATLTPEQLREIDEITIDEEMNNKTLEVAINFHANRKNVFFKRQREWWEEMGRIYGFDPQIEHEVDLTKAIITIKEKV